VREGSVSCGYPMMVGSDSSGQVRGSQSGLGVHMDIWAMVHKATIEATDVLKRATSSMIGLVFMIQGELRLGGKPIC
jgi:hypothetical protein